MSTADVEDLEPYPEEGGGEEHAPARPAEPPLKQGLVVALIASGLGGLYLASNWSELFPSDAGALAQGARVGRVYRVQAGVRHRPVGSVLWRDFPGSVVEAREGDAIFTDAEGRARLELQNGVSVEIQGSSLIVIRQAEPPDFHADGMKTVLQSFARKQPVLDIGAGRVNVNFTGEAVIGIQAADKGRSFVSGQFTVVQAARESETAGDFRLSMREAGSSVKIASADQASADGFEAIVLKPGETMAVKPESPLKPEQRLTSSTEPEDGAVVFALPGDPIRLSWKWKRKFLEVGDQFLLNLEGPVSKLERVDPGLTSWNLELPSGTYHWRLEIIRDQYIFRSPRASFEVRRFEAPRLLGPANGAELPRTGTAESPVALTYERLARGVTVQIELIDEATQRPAKTVSAGPLGAEVTLPEGHYRWRARAFAGDRHEYESNWSPYSKFAVTPPRSGP